MSGGQKITWRLIGAAVVVTVIVLAAGWLFTERSRMPPVLASQSRVGTPRVAAPSRRLSEVAPEPVPPAERATRIDECGIAGVLSTGVEGGSSDGLVIAAGSKTHQRWEAALLDSSDPHARAVGLVMRRSELISAGSIMQAEEPRDELVQLAVGAGDPALYAVAIGLCRKSLSDDNTPSACQRISVSEWARLDPDNAVPWILSAQAARSQNDAQSEETAFAQAADAHKIDDYSESLFSYGFTELPQGIAPAEKVSLAIELIGYEAAWIAPVAEISHFCSDAALRQAGIHHECAAVADLLVSRGNSLIMFSYGAKLGGRVGWSPERVRSLLQEREALSGLLANQNRGTGCEIVNRTNAFFASRVQLGELAALRTLRDQLGEQSEP